jgi:hypothetical protein
MPDGERRKPIHIEVCRSKVKVSTSKNRTKIRYFLAHLTQRGQKQELPLAAIFVGGMGRNEETL